MYLKYTKRSHTPVIWKQNYTHLSEYILKLHRDRAGLYTHAITAQLWYWDAFFISIPQLHDMSANSWAFQQCTIPKRQVSFLQWLSHGTMIDIWNCISQWEQANLGNCLEAAERDSIEMEWDFTASWIFKASCSLGKARHGRISSSKIRLKNGWGESQSTTGDSRHKRNSSSSFGSI